MEKIKVNMSPNPLDVQTIHASQNDTEAREWEFELHNNGELIDTSDVKEQMVFKSYKGGTEQILPENGSTPTTSPFKGNIKYPQGLLSDQEFTYRQSPTESDGLAKITDIKGNTIVWNQLIASNETVNLNRDSARTYNVSTNNTRSVVGHKYCFATTITSDNTSGGLNCRFGSDFNVGKGVGRHFITFTANDANNASIYCYIQSNEESGTALSFVDSVLFDLTLMGLADKTDAEILQWFADYFPLNYYSYNSGSLIPFMGNGIKTVGFNQWDEEWKAGTLNSDGSTSSSSDRIITSYVPVLPNITYSMTIPYNGRGRGAFYDENKHLIEYFYDFPVSGRNDVFPRDGLISSAGNNYYFSFIPPAGTAFVRYNTGTAYGATYENNICINISDTERNGTYEPYTSHTTNLPVSTYFPTGMKSAGNVYDELTESKAISRVGSVDLGTLTWNHVNSGSNGYWQVGTGSIPNAKYISNYSGINIKGINPVDGSVIQSVGIYQMDGGTLSKIGIAQNGSANYQNASATVAPTGILYYELATPTETPITTASLVTENSEIPLSNDDGVLIGKCTEQLSENPGFIDAKIKLSDSDGECYSNKLQLHIERSPQ